MLALLMAVVVEPAQSSEAISGQGKGLPVSTEDAEQAEETALACLVLVGGTALLAGSVWVGTLRRMLP